LEKEFLSVKTDQEGGILHYFGVSHARGFQIEHCLQVIQARYPRNLSTDPLSTIIAIQSDTSNITKPHVVQYYRCFLRYTLRSFHG